MKIKENHDTTIGKFIEYIDETTCFISTWEKENDTLSFNSNLVKNAVELYEDNRSKYFFMDEMQELKTWYNKEVFIPQNIEISTHNFVFAPNGTTSAFVILQMLNQIKKIKAVLLSPIYFTYINVLRDMKADIEYMQVISNGKLSIDYAKLEQIISEKKINLLILNDPIFGTGVPIHSADYFFINDICKKYDIHLFIDYIYGGMEWNSERTIINKFLVNMVRDFSNIILIESVSKRLFLNGLKNCLVFGSSEFIRNFERCSTYTIGSLVYSQITIIQQIYAKTNRNTVLNQINENILFAKSNYELLCTTIANTKLSISDCSSGYFCILGIPYSCLKCTSSDHAAIKIMDDTNILTIPHDRYLYFDKQFYYFRVNLTLKNLITSIYVLLDTYLNQVN